MSGFEFSQRSKDRMIGVAPDLIRVAERAIELTKVDFGIPQYGGRRSEDEQKHLFVTGASKADGEANLSFHQMGDALDFYAIDPETKAASWEPGLLAQVAAAFLQAAIELDIDLEWGGLWTSFIDAPHVQVVRGSI